MSLNPDEFWGNSVIAKQSTSTYVPRVKYVLPDVVFEAIDEDGSTIQWDFYDILRHIIRISPDAFLKGYIIPDEIWAKSQDPQLAMWREWEDSIGKYPKPWCGKRVYMTMINRIQMNDENDKPLILDDGKPVMHVEFRMTKKRAEREKKAREAKKKCSETENDWTLYCRVNVLKNPEMGWSDKPKVVQKRDPKTGDMVDTEVVEKKDGGFRYQGTTFCMSSVLKEKVQAIVKENLEDRIAKGQNETDYYFFAICEKVNVDEWKGKTYYKVFSHCDWVVV